MTVKLGEHECPVFIQFCKNSTPVDYGRKLRLRTYLLKPGPNYTHRSYLLFQ